MRAPSYAQSAEASLALNELFAGTTAELLGSPLTVAFLDGGARGLAPEIICMGPVAATRKVLIHQGVDVSQLTAVELNKP